MHCYLIKQCIMPSSVVAAFNYDAPHHTLNVVYVSGKKYAYKNVPEQVYLEMKEAFSKGTYLNQNIKGKYPFKKMN